MIVRFAFVTEGSSDRGLEPHLQRMCLAGGATEVIAHTPDLARLVPSPGKDVRSQVQAALTVVPDADIIFVHRDSDGNDPNERREEIERGVNAVTEFGGRWVAVVAIQELEAWLLLDERAIREVAGNPRGRVPLRLPNPRRVEEVACPKELLREAIELASEKTGRRLQDLRTRFPALRATLLERLDPEGPIRELSGWQRIVRDTEEVVRRLIERGQQQEFPIG